jgi:hypothetical protein
MTFTINDCYWHVAGDETKVWSSAAGAYVLMDDPNYTRWLTLVDNYVRTVETEQDLINILTGQGFPAPARLFAEKQK